MGTASCPRCGHGNPADANFCVNCGAPLQEQTTAHLAPVEVEDQTGERIYVPLDELVKGQAILVVTRGPTVGSRMLIDSRVTSLGRHPDSDVFLDDITVSRHHAEIQREEGIFLFRDLGSLNGSYVNGRALERVQLTNGDELQIGRFKLVFFAAQA
jgi:pSer/pThr/pTyr-binding forkhead associated (FHA) protein